MNSFSCENKASLLDNSLPKLLEMLINLGYYEYHEYQADISPAVFMSGGAPNDGVIRSHLIFSVEKAVLHLVLADFASQNVGIGTKVWRHQIIYLFSNSDSKFCQVAPYLGQPHHTPGT